MPRFVLRGTSAVLIATEPIDLLRQPLDGTACCAGEDAVRRVIACTRKVGQQLHRVAAPLTLRCRILDLRITGHAAFPSIGGNVQKGA